MWVAMKLSGYCQGLWWRVRCLSMGQPGLLYISGKFHPPAWVACLEDRTHDRHLGKAWHQRMQAQEVPGEWFQINSRVISCNVFVKSHFWNLALILKGLHTIISITKMINSKWTNTWVCFGKSEISNPLFIQTQVPSDCYVVLSL